jgi:hypothetical protein
LLPARPASRVAVVLGRAVFILGVEVADKPPARGRIDRDGWKVGISLLEAIKERL